MVKFLAASTSFVRQKKFDMDGKIGFQRALDYTLYSNIWFTIFVICYRNRKFDVWCLFHLSRSIVQQRSQHLLLWSGRLKNKVLSGIFVYNKLYYHRSAFLRSTPNKTMRVRLKWRAYFEEGGVPHFWFVTFTESC